MVENVGVAVGISLLSYSLTEIQSTFGVLTAILFYASHLMSAKNHSIMSVPALFDKFSTMPSSTYKKNYTSLTDIRLLDVLLTITVISGFQPPLFSATPDISVIHSCDHENVW